MRDFASPHHANAPRESHTSSGHTPVPPDTSSPAAQREELVALADGTGFHSHPGVPARAGLARHADGSPSREECYEWLFDNVPLAAWEEDFSAVRSRIAEWRAEGIHDLRAHLRENPAELASLAETIRVTIGNREAWTMVKPSSQHDDIPRLRDLMGRQALPFLLDLFAALDDGAVRFEQAISFRSPAGQERIHQVRVTVPPGQEHLWKRVLVTSEDLTAHLRLEGELAKFKAVAEDERHGRVLTDANGCITYANRCYAASLGVTPEALVGRPLVDFWAQSAASQAAEAPAALAATGSWGHELIVQSDGDRHAYPAEVFATAVRDAAGRIQYAGFSIIDITQRLALEGRLREAQKMDAVGRLAGGVAHEFNNLLQSIIGHAELARFAAAAGRDNTAEIGQIMVAADRAKHMVRQLLVFGRPQALEFEVADLGRAIESDLGILRRLVGEKIRIEWQPAHEALRVRIDRSAIMQVLTNLCANAHDAMHGSGTITIGTGSVELGAEDCIGHAGAFPGRYAWVAVTDTGDGIPAPILEQVFLPFFTTKTFGAGTGLGLSTVHGLVCQHGGIIRVHTQEGKGTEFRIELPLEPSPTSDPPA